MARVGEATSPSRSDPLRKPRQRVLIVCRLVGCKRPVMRSVRPTSRPSSIAVASLAVADDDAERAAGYDHGLAICQLEISLTQVFERAVQGPSFLRSRDSREPRSRPPDRVRLLFPLRLTRATPPPAFGYRTRVITDGVQPSLHVEYKSSHVKQYFKRAARAPDRNNDQ
jgi:hypothetical protein